MVVARKPKSHASTSTPSSPELSDLISVLPSIFHEAQASQANHRKNISRLVKTQAVCAEVVLARSKGSPKLVGELAFTSAFIGCVERVLGVKKGVVVGDKVCKFVAGFVAAIAAQGQCRPSVRAGLPSFRRVSELTTLHACFTVDQTSRRRKKKTKMKIRPLPGSTPVSCSIFSKAS
jgi:hypothetical protein